MWEKERNPYFDNAKLFLIFFVVLQHFLPGDNDFINQICKTIGFFHMPAFALISGHFAKSAVPLRFVKIKKYIFLYIVFEVVYAIMYPGPIFLFPYAILWYLLTLIFWYILLQVFVKLKFSILLAFVIGILVGYIPEVGRMLSLSRTFVFFPFFLIGFYLKREHFEIIRKPVLKIVIAAAAFMFLFVVAWYLPFPGALVTADVSYKNMGLDMWYAGLFRIFLYIVTTILVFCFYALIPHKKYSFTYLGANTLNTYVMHGFIFYLITYGIAADLFNSLSLPLQVITAFILTVIVVLVFSTQATAKIFDVIFVPMLKLGKRKKAPVE